ncbi:MAG: hypothetical protein R3C26_26470 [Calditrichia bacterium]
MIIFEGFGGIVINIRFANVGRKAQWLTLRNEMYETIKKRFEEEGIAEIPSRTGLFMLVRPSNRFRWKCIRRTAQEEKS